MPGPTTEGHAMHRTERFTREVRTTQSARTVLDSVSAQCEQEGFVVQEKMPSYVVVGSNNRIRFAAPIAVAVGVLILFAVLGLTAISPLFVVLIPLAVLPALPFAIARSATATVAAVNTDDDSVISVDGRVTENLRRVLDAALDSASATTPQL